MLIIFTTFWCVITCCTALRQELGLCSQVYSMSQYCSGDDVTRTDDVTVIKGRVGKAGARGPPGDRGLPGFVNYTHVEEKMAAKMKEVENRFAAKFAEYENAMDQTVLKLERKLKVLPITGCDVAKPGNAIVKSGTGGVFDIYSGGTETKVFCDLTTDGGKWTVFQRRIDGYQDFNQNWNTYVAGFGDLTGEFWIGLEKLHLLTQDGDYELQIEMTNGDGTVGIAKYQTFSVSGSSENYKLNVGGFSGTGVGDKLAYHNNKPFSTKDRDNDTWGDSSCAAQLKGGWWFGFCHHSSLNGVYGETGSVAWSSLGIYWSSFNNIRKTEMKFRKK